MEQEFTEFSEFRETDKSLNWAQFKDPVLTCVLLALW